MWDLLMILSLVAAVFTVATGLVLFWAWCGEQRLAHMARQVTERAMVEEAKRTYGKKRADEREWQRAA